MKTTRWFRVAWLVILLSAPAIVSAQDQTAGLPFDPAMVKGPATAPVTIVEFSDYQ